MILSHHINAFSNDREAPRWPILATTWAENVPGLRIFPSTLAWQHREKRGLRGGSCGRLCEVLCVAFLLETRDAVDRFAFQTLQSIKEVVDCHGSAISPEAGEVTLPAHLVDELQGAQNALGSVPRRVLLHQQVSNSVDLLHSK
jgi:hypothetical protein